MNNDYTLRFHKDGKFRILMISDFHTSVNREKRVCTRMMIAGIEALLNEINPDMVLIGGDQCIPSHTIEEVTEDMAYILSPYN